MDGGRKLSFERSFSLEREVKPKRSFWTRVVDVIAGAARFSLPGSPYSVATDSRGRIIVTDVAAAGVHIFDFEQQKYKFLSRRDAGKDPMLTPQCVAVDAQDNIYVTDSQAGKIFVFDANGKYRRAIGSLKGGEGYFKRPTGIAVDSAAQRIYVTDTLRNKIFMMDMQGSVLQIIGKTGTGDGEFNYPTELRLHGSGSGGGRCHEFPRAGVRPLRHVSLRDRESRRRHGMDVPSEGNWLRFRRPSLHRGRTVGRGAGVRRARAAALLLRRRRAPGAEQFQLPTGLQIDNHDRIYVVDSFNRRVQVFHYYGDRASRGREEAAVKRVLHHWRLLACSWSRSAFAQVQPPAQTCSGMHNLSLASGASVYSQGSLGCTFCHAPHSGLGGITPLWNQKLSTEIYTPYTSTTVSPSRETRSPRWE